MNRTADNLRNLRTPTTFRAAQIMTVVSLGDDPTQVVVSDGSADMLIPAASAYPIRAEQDQVLCIQLAGGSWLALTKVGAVATNYVGGGPIVPDDRGGWRTAGTATSDNPQAGTFDSGSDWIGAWFYGTKIADACVGHTVTGMAVRLSRPDRAGGYNTGVPIHLGLHTNLTRGKPALTDLWTPTRRLSKGGTVTLNIPTAQRVLLANGTARGIGVYGSGRDEYLIFGATAPIDVQY